MAVKRRRTDDDHVCPAVEAYLLTYSDMITALLIFFIVMFAMGQIDIAKFEKFKMGIARSGATPIDDGLLENGEGPFEQAIVRPEVISSPDDQDGPGGDGDRNGFGPDQAMAEREAFEQAQLQISSALAGVEVGSDVSFRVEERGLVITIVSDRVLFAPGSASLTPDGTSVVDALAVGLSALPNRMTVEGHTDSRPISTARFPSNWELSVGSSSTVLRALVEQHGLPAGRLNAAGYADQRPVATNETSEGRAANRRVEIVVHSLAEGHEPDVADLTDGGGA
jgi:chemotaxis protein MotB